MSLVTVLSFYSKHADLVDSGFLRTALLSLLVALDSTSSTACYTIRMDIESLGTITDRDGI